MVMFRGARGQERVHTQHKAHHGGQRDGAGRANLARRGGQQHSRHTPACSGRENGMWPDHRVTRDRDEKERNHRAGLAPHPQVQGSLRWL